MTEAYEDLLKRLPEFAKAVNSFSSEAVQMRAFEALLTAWFGKPEPRPAGPQANGKSTQGSRGRGSRARGATSDAQARNGPSRTKTSAGLAMIADLDLRPKAGKSLKDFAQEKKPQSAHDQTIVSVYYLKQVRGIGAVSVNHVYTCYKHMGWRIPSNLPNQLSVLASRKGWLSTQNKSDIQLTTHGENYVDHDLPPAAKK